MMRTLFVSSVFALVLSMQTQAHAESYRYVASDGYAGLEFESTVQQYYYYSADFSDKSDIGGPFEPCSTSEYYCLDLGGIVISVTKNVDTKTWKIRDTKFEITDKNCNKTACIFTIAATRPSGKKHFVTYSTISGIVGLTLEYNPSNRQGRPYVLATDKGLFSTPPTLHEQFRECP